MAYENQIHSVKVSLPVLPIAEPGYGDWTGSVIDPKIEYLVVSAYGYAGPQTVGVWPTPGVCDASPLGICQNSPRLYWQYDAVLRTYTTVKVEEAEVLSVGISKAIIGIDTANATANSGRTYVNAGDKVRVAFDSDNYNVLGYITYDISGEYNLNHVGVALQYGQVGDIIPVAVNCL
jgi:hypothetical protein